MEINLTLLVQMFHFLLAWLLIQKFLLEPALKAIHAEQNEYQSKKDDIDTVQQEYDQKSHYKQEQWKECQRQFAIGVPADIQTLHLLRMAQPSEEIVGKRCETTVRKTDIKEMAQVLTKRIEHIDD